jgi:hypothetical protein
MALVIYSADGSVRPPEHWAVVPDLVWEVATYLDRPRDVLSMGLVNWRFRDAIDDSVWRVLCHLPVFKRVPRYYPSFQHYYRVVHMERGSKSQFNTYCAMPRGVARQGNIVKRSQGGKSSGDCVPLVRTTKQDRCEILLLEHAEHVYVGVSSSAAPGASQGLYGNGFQLYVMPYVNPGTLLNVQTVTLEVDGAPTPCLKATRPAAQGNTEDVVMCEPLPQLYSPEWCFTVGLGAQGASCAVL